MIRVRAARPADAAAASRIMVRAITRLCAADHGNRADLIAAWCANKTPETVVRWIATPGGTILLATHDGVPAGVCGYDHRGLILLNYADPDHLARGVGRAMLDNMERALAARGVTGARLESTATARDFYRAHGWKQAGPPVVKFGMPGYPMKKPLAPPRVGG